MATPGHRARHLTVRALAFAVWLAFVAVWLAAAVAYGGTLSAFEDAVRANAKAHRAHIAECRNLADGNARRLCAAIEDARERKALANAEASYRETVEAYQAAARVARAADERLTRERAAVREP